MLYKRMFIRVMGIVLVFAGTANADFKMGDKLVIKAGDTVKDAICFGDDVQIYGTVKDSAVSFGGDVIVENGGLVMGDVVSLGGDIRIRNNGIVKKDAVSVGGEIKIDCGGEILGEKVDLSGIPVPFAHLPVPSFCDVRETAGDLLSGIGKIIILGPFIGVMSVLGVVFVTVLLMMKLLVKCGIAALVTYLAPRHVKNMAVCVRTDFLKAFLVGVVSIIIIPFLFILLLVSLVGIPLIPLTIILLVIAYLFGSVGIALWAGSILPIAEKRSDMHNALLGVLVIGLIRFIPVVGFLTGFVTGVLAIGVVIITRFGAEQYPRA